MERRTIAGFVACLVLAAFSANAAEYMDRPPAHRITAPTGVLDPAAEGVRLLEDYGAFALYEVSADALQQLEPRLRAQLAIRDDMDRLLLDAQVIDTRKGPPDLPPDLVYADLTGSALQLIQFVGPIRQAWLDTIAAAGARPVHYIANNGYLVWVDDAARAHLDALAAEGAIVRYSEPYQPYFKLGTTLRDAGLGKAEIQDKVVEVTVQMLRHPEAAASEDTIAQTAIEQLVPWWPILEYQNAVFKVHSSDVKQIARLPDVVWVGERGLRELNDEVQNQIVAGNLDASQAGPSGPGYLAWLDGLGFSQDPTDYPIVDITDDGIGTGSVNSLDPTLHQLGSTANPTRLTYVANCTSASDGGSPGGHGHINVSIAGGYDVRTGSPYQDADGFNLGLGINPYGRFAGTRIFGPGFNLSACGGTDPGLIKAIQDSGADISSNSWGCAGCAPQYDDSSQAFDVGVRDADPTESGNQELTFVFSAGNSGPSGGTIGTPGNAKNVITVGAAENDRPTWTDGCLIGPSGADNAMDVISFSSRGPAPGGRVKPETIAPGTHIQGTASTHPSYNGANVCDTYHPVGQTIFAASSGTSHSTPALSGAASLLHRWLADHYATPSPSPALTKAYLIAHPTYLTGVSAGDTLPSNSQGYGMPTLDLMFDETPRQLLDQSVLLTDSGQIHTLDLAASDPSKPVRVVLAYTDAAGAIGTSPQVNNLDLSVSAGSATYFGNRFSGAWSVKGGGPDPANNYEAVFLPAGTSGPLLVTVTAFNIAGDGVPGNGDPTDQDFAVVCYNCIPGSCGDGILDPGEQCDGAEIGGAACGDASCSIGTPSCTAMCTLDYSTCQCCEQDDQAPTSDSGDFFGGPLAYDGNPVTFAEGQHGDRGTVTTEHFFDFPDAGVLSGTLSVTISNDPGVIGDESFTSASYSIAGGGLQTLGSTNDLQQTFTVELTDVDLGQLSVRVFGAPDPGNGPPPFPIGHARAHEIHFAADRTAGCECEVDADCTDRDFCTVNETCVDGACQAESPCVGGETCLEEHDVCEVVDFCPATRGCIGSPQGTCRSAIFPPTDCPAGSTGEIACFLSNGDLVECDAGETIHIRNCPCEAIIPGAFCINESQSFFCDD